MPRTLLDLFSHIVVHFHVEYVRYQVQRILVVLYFRVQASQVESVREIVLIDLAEVFIPSRRDELYRTSNVSNDQAHKQMLH